jgi:hypothetical protein
MLSSRAFSLNDFAREGEALATAHFATEPLIGAFRMRRARTHGIADFMFAKGIADTDNHHQPPNANHYHG